MPDIY